MHKGNLSRLLDLIERMEVKYGSSVFTRRSACTRATRRSRNARRQGAATPPPAQTTALGRDRPGRVPRIHRGCNAHRPRCRSLDHAAYTCGNHRSLAFRPPCLRRVLAAAHDAGICAFASVYADLRTDRSHQPQGGSGHGTAARYPAKHSHSLILASCHPGTGSGLSTLEYRTGTRQCVPDFYQSSLEYDLQLLSLGAYPSHRSARSLDRHTPAAMAALPRPGTAILDCWRASWIVCNRCQAPALQSPCRHRHLASRLLARLPVGSSCSYWVCWPSSACGPWYSCSYRLIWEPGAHCCWQPLPHGCAPLPLC